MQFPAVFFVFGTIGFKIRQYQVPTYQKFHSVYLNFRGYEVECSVS